jgi:hypothetical protein
MSIETYRRINNIFVSFSPNDTNNKKNLVTCEVMNNGYLGLNSELEIINHNITLKDLKIFSKIMSLTPSPLPNIALEDTDSQRILKILNNEQNSEKYQIDIYLSRKNLSDISYLRIGSINILDRGYQFSQYDVLEVIGGIDLGLNFGLAAAMRNVGDGYITELDTLNVIGSFISEITIYYKDTTIINGGNSGGGSSTDTITWNNITSNQWDNLTSTQWGVL